MESDLVYRGRRNYTGSVPTLANRGVSLICNLVFSLNLVLGTIGALVDHNERREVRTMNLIGVRPQNKPIK